MEISPNRLDPGLIAADTANKVDMAVAKKALDTVKQQGEAMVSMIKSAAENAPGRSIRDGSGRLDLRA